LRRFDVKDKQKDRIGEIHCHPHDTSPPLPPAEQKGDEIPESTPITQLRPESNQAVVLVDVWMPAFRDQMENKAIKKTLTIPKWLNDLAEQNNVNFSHVLQNTLKNYLGINESKNL